MTTGGWSGCACSIQNRGTHPPHTDGADDRGRTDSRPTREHRIAQAASSGCSAFPWRPALALGAGLGSQGAARGRVDALVAVVPADPIARRGIATEHFLNHTRARSTGDRLRLSYDTLADCKGHAHSRLGSSEHNRAIRAEARGLEPMIQTRRGQPIRPVAPGERPGRGASLAKTIRNRPLLWAARAIRRGAEAVSVRIAGRPNLLASLQMCAETRTHAQCRGALSWVRSRGAAA